MPSSGRSVMETSHAYLGLGSNVGDRAVNLNAALTALGTHAAVIAVSSTYETEPVGFADQSPFLNLVCQVSDATASRPAACG